MLNEVAYMNTLKYGPQNLGKLGAKANYVVSSESRKGACPTTQYNSGRRLSKQFKVLGPSCWKT